MVIPCDFKFQKSEVFAEDKLKGACKKFTWIIYGQPYSKYSNLGPTRGLKV